MPLAADNAYRLLFDAHPQPMWVFDQQSKRVLAVNVAAISHGEFTALAELAHRLKSSSRSIGALALGTCCDRIERADPACGVNEMHALVASLEDALADVMTRLSAEVGQAQLDAAV